MIGVLPKLDQLAVVEEFFELFKTPWELYRPGRRYDAVVATVDDIPQVDARLLLIFGPETKNTDARDRVARLSRHHGTQVRHRDTIVPIHGDLLTFEDHETAVSCLTSSWGTAGLRMGTPRSQVIRLGYDLFREVEFLLTSGQPVAQAHIPTLDLHISMMREWILDAGISFVEIPPVPAGRSFAVCLTHDIDFVGIRNHRFDHSMWGFLYRSTIGAMRNLLRRRISVARLLKTWFAAVSLPFVYLGWVNDFWEPFEWYLGVEANLSATYYLIPFKHRKGEHVPGRHGSRRATKYDVGDLPEWTATLTKAGCEIGVHGIDAWHNVDKGNEELVRIGAVTANPHPGIRMHWLLQNADTARLLEKAGYAYDSSFGYNETVGYRSGTAQVFRPVGAHKLLELPLHIQDGALFFPNRLDLSEAEAWKRCSDLIANASKLGGVLTLVWHDRSHGPERFWGDFYIRLVKTLKSSNVWFGTATDVVGWFRKRRDVRFELRESAGGARTFLSYDGEEIRPPLTIRVHRSSVHNDGATDDLVISTFVDIPWNAKTAIQLDSTRAAELSLLS